MKIVFPPKIKRRRDRIRQERETERLEKRVM